MVPIRPGNVIADRFEIVRVADSGGMGIVYQARDRTTDRSVALKVLLHGDEAPADRFAAEVELLSTLEHPHIVGYVSHGTTEDGIPFLVMPWLEGIDLEERLRGEPLSIEETLTLARRVADALAYLHGRGLVHRDLKPSNLFLPGGRVEHVQVIDLGVARASLGSRALTMSGVLIGTPGFIAPEQARGDRDIAPAVDIFAFGCVLFECLTGRRLFSGAHVMSVLAKILLEDAPRVRELRPDAPSSLDLLIHRMVAKEPEKRPRDGAQLAEWLDDAVPAPLRESDPPTLNALTASERRVVTVLVVVLPKDRFSIRPMADETRVEADPLGAAAGRFGVRAQRLFDHTAIVLAPAGVAAADQAAILARFGRHVAQTIPGTSVALTTGSAITGSPLPAGEALDRAVTLVRRASPHTGLLVDDVTAALITARFDIRSDGGKLVVTSERISLDPTRPLLGRPTSCVGREHELAVLEATATECGEWRGPKVVLVTAAAGAGKSRLRHELVRRLGAHASPPMVLHCQGDPLHVAAPYALVAQAVRQGLELHAEDSPERLREKLVERASSLVAEADAPRLADFLGELVGVRFDDEGHLLLRAARSDAAAMSDQIGRAFEEVLRGWSARRLVVFVLEDLHWGDTASVKLLERALRKLESSRLFVLALARPEVRDRFPLLFANRDVTEVRLPPLTKRACTTLVHAVMGEDAHIDVAEIVDRSEGNAFFLEELIRAAAERVGSGDTSAISRGGDLPATVVALAQARLERLEPAVRKVLRAASVFGGVFCREGVSALLGVTPESIERELGMLIEHEAIAESELPRLGGAREFVFRHTLLRGTAYSTLTDEDRVLGHRLAAQWLDQAGEDGEVVALHWLDAQDRSRAAARFTQVAEGWWSGGHADVAARCVMRALLVGDATVETAIAISTRIHLLASALGATRSLDAREVITGLERHAPALETSSREQSGSVVSIVLERTLDALRAGRESSHLAGMLADAACALGALADFVGAKRLLAEATARDAEDYARLRATRYAAAKIAYWENDGAAAVELLAETVLPADPGERFDILLILAWAVVMVDGRAALPRALDFVSRAEAIRGAGGDLRSLLEDPIGRLQCAKARVVSFYLAGEYASGAEAAEEAIALARRSGLRFDECVHLHNAGDQYLRLGKHDQARLALTASSELAGDLGAPRMARLNDVVLAVLDGRAERLSLLAEDARRAADTWRELYARYWLGRLLASSGAPDARTALEHALDLARKLKVRTMTDDCTRALTELDRVPA